MNQDSKNFSDVSEAIYHAGSVPEAIRNQINILKNNNTFEANILANKVELYYNYIINRALLNNLRSHFDNLYNEIDTNFPEVLFRLEGRRKSWISAYKKLLTTTTSVDDILKDISAFRLIVFADSNSIQLCYNLAKHIIDYSVDQGYIPCIADKPKDTDKFDPKKHPDVIVPTQSCLPKELQLYVKDYIMYPKEKGYQSLHIIFSDKDGNHFEIQIRDINMHILAEYGSANHRDYKNKYPDIHLDRSKINIPGYRNIITPDGKSQTLDFVGLEHALEIFHRQKTHA